MTAFLAVCSSDIFLGTSAWRESTSSLVSFYIRALILLSQGSTIKTAFNLSYLGLPRWPSWWKYPPANAGDITEASSIPGSGRFPGAGHGSPLPYSWLENPMTKEPDEVQSTGSQRVARDWSDLACMHSLSYIQKFFLLNVITLGFRASTHRFGRSICSILPLAP